MPTFPSPPADRSASGRSRDIPYMPAAPDPTAENFTGLYRHSFTYDYPDGSRAILRVPWAAHAHEGDINGRTPLNGFLPIRVTVADVTRGMPKLPLIPVAATPWMLDVIICPSTRTAHYCALSFVREGCQRRDVWAEIDDPFPLTEARIVEELSDFYAFSDAESYDTLTANTAKVIVEMSQRLLTEHESAPGRSGDIPEHADDTTTGTQQSAAGGPGAVPDMSAPSSGDNPTVTQESQKAYSGTTLRTTVNGYRAFIRPALVDTHAPLAIVSAPTKEHINVRRAFGAQYTGRCHVLAIVDFEQNALAVSLTDQHVGERVLHFSKVIRVLHGDMFDLAPRTMATCRRAGLTATACNDAVAAMSQLQISLLEAIASQPTADYTDTAIEAAITPNPTTPDTDMTTPAAATITSVIANALDRPTIAAMKQGADQGVSHASFDGLVRKVRGIIEVRYPIATMLPDELANGLTTFAIAELTAEGGFLRGPLGEKAATFINARALASLTMSAGLITEGIIAPVVAEFKAFAAQAGTQTPADASA